MLSRNRQGYEEFVDILENFVRRAELIRVLDNEFDDYLDIPEIDGNEETHRLFRGFIRMRDLFDYPFSKQNDSEYKKYIYACFVYSYLRYAEKEVYFRNLRYIEITVLTDYFTIDHLRTPQQMKLYIQSQPHLFPSLTQFDIDLQEKLINLLHEIAALFTKPITGFSDNDLNQIIQNPFHPNDYQDYFHNVTKKYFNYYQMHAIKTFKSHESYIRAISMSQLVDISGIETSILKIVGVAFFDDINYFNLKSKSKETTIINFTLISKLLYDMHSSILMPINKIYSMIRIAAWIDLNRVISLF